MTVYHENNHICVEKANRPEKEAFLKNNMRISNITRAPKHVQMEMLSQCVAEGDFDKAYDVVKLIDDRELIEQMRYTGDIADHMNRASMSTLESFNSITQMKEKTDPKDKYLIYDLACKGLSGAQKSFVFTSSEGVCRIALKMDLANQGNKEKPSELTQGYVYMDAMHSRTKDYKNPRDVFGAHRFKIHCYIGCHGGQREKTLQLLLCSYLLSRRCCGNTKGILSMNSIQKVASLLMKLEQTLMPFEKYLALRC